MSARINQILKENGVTPEQYLKDYGQKCSPEELAYLQELIVPPMAEAIARKFVGMGAHVIFFPRGTKACKTPNWEEIATNDLSTATRLAAQDPSANVGLVGKQDGVWGLDDDAGLVAEYEKAHGPIQTYGTRTVSGGRHFIFRQNAASWALGNVSVKDEQNRELLSARINDRYVVAAGSWAYPNNDESQPLTQYTAINPAASIVEAPQSLLDFITAKAEEWKAKKTKTTNDISTPQRVHEGGRNNYLTSRAGALRNAGASHDSILADLRRMNENECVPSLPDKEVEAIAASVSKYEVGPAPLVLNQTTDAPPPSIPNLDTSDGATRPVFPLWAIQGTSIYENLVKPAVATSSKFEEFIYMPALQIMANYLSRKVNIELQPTNLNLFVGLVSPYGQFFKSTSCELAYRYFECVGICGEMTKTAKNAEGKVFTFQAASPEGFGLRMHKANCLNSILTNDELGKFVSKAGIESSSFSSDLLTWYGSGSFGNNVKSEKDSFSFESGTYTFGWLWCTTDRGFNRHWPKLAGMSSGLEDRMFFVVSPEKPKPAGPYSNPNYLEGALKTRQLIDKAVNQRQYRIEEPEMYAMRVQGMDPRSMDLVKKLALVIAVDLGSSVIDDDAVERACALVAYRNQAAAYLEPIEADNIEGRLQKEVLRELRQNKGKMSYRELCLNLDYGRYGTRLWKTVYQGLLGHGEIAEFQEARTQGKRTTRMVGLVKHDEDE